MHGSSFFSGLRPGTDNPDRGENEKDGDEGSPGGRFAQSPPGEKDKNAERYRLLNDLELCGGQYRVADAIRRNLQGVFGQSDQPAEEDRREDGCLFVSKMVVPCERHEAVREDQQRDGGENRRHGFNPRNDIE